MSIGDSNFQEKFLVLYDEHVIGFSGKAYTKRKSEKDSNMLWRQRLKKNELKNTQQNEQKIAEKMANSDNDETRTRKFDSNPVSKLEQKIIQKKKKLQKKIAAAPTDTQQQAQLAMLAYRASQKMKSNTAKPVAQIAAPAFARTTATGNNAMSKDRLLAVYRSLGRK